MVWIVRRKKKRLLGCFFIHFVLTYVHEDTKLNKILMCVFYDKGCMVM